MIEIPIKPSTALVAVDDSDVFVSFHFDARNPFDARLKAAQLTLWVREFLQANGLATEVEFDGVLDG